MPVGLIFISYIFVISSILKIPSAKGRKKTFATCASHLTVVIVHYGCASIAYLKPKSENAIEKVRKRKAKEKELADIEYQKKKLEKAEEEEYLRQVEEQAID